MEVCHLECGSEVIGLHPLVHRDESELDRCHQQAGNLQPGGGDRPHRGSRALGSVPSAHVDSVQRTHSRASNASICPLLGGTVTKEMLAVSTCSRPAQSSSGLCRALHGMRGQSRPGPVMLSPLQPSGPPALNAGLLQILAAPGALGTSLTSPRLSFLGCKVGISMPSAPSGVEF